jgi:nucleoside-diphosphate-sugar epimerase
MTKKVAVIAGVTGIVGRNLARQLAQSDEWKVYGLSRIRCDIDGVEPIAADLRDSDSLEAAVANKSITHVFYTSWLRQPTEELNCKVNGDMFENLLKCLKNDPLTHVTLVTGGKHYFGSFSDSGKHPVVTPYREEQERKPGLNFYYVQEDILFQYSAAQNFTWSVHRPNTIIGYALGNAMNMGTTLAAYATICKESGRPFLFPGSKTIYDGISDSTDARVLAKHLEWSATTDGAQDQAFNTVNGDVFRWNWMWEKIADYFGLKVAQYGGVINPLEEIMKHAGYEWDTIVAKHKLRPTTIDQVASWWHTDSDLSRPFETFADMSKSRKLGFLEYKKSNESFTELFDQLRNDRIIP